MAEWSLIRRSRTLCTKRQSASRETKSAVTNAWFEPPRMRRPTRARLPFFGGAPPTGDSRRSLHEVLLLLGR
ncbi:hypothetical protein [Streptomyces sp. NPDC017993]|uniref:hypothetical protein n=1 Tax=Streptomyces sp. NPDC017993 TaxID=3365027 RepID=UPI0037A9E350